MRAIFALALLVVFASLAIAVVHAQHHTLPELTEEVERMLFTTWKTQHSKAYESSTHEEDRFQVWRVNLHKIRQHNVSGQTHSLAVNKFADLSEAEFRQIYLRPLDLSARQPAPGGVHKYDGVAQLGDTNWVSAGMVTSVKDQGQCGSCWSFSSTGAIESASAIAGNQLTDLSEQQMVDCSTQNSGCNGGLMDYAFQYIINNGGQQSLASYPYVAVQGTCNYQGPASATISSYQDVSADDNSMRSALTQQPVAIAIDASQLQFYSGGIISTCGTTLDHGVLAVGFTSNSYTIKNSWGPSWGESGYFRLAPNNTCGMLQSASYPIV